jgi:hypothetical protein
MEMMKRQEQRMDEPFVAGTASCMFATIHVALRQAAKDLGVEEMYANADTATFCAMSRQTFEVAAQCLLEPQLGIAELDGRDDLFAATMDVFHAAATYVLTEMFVPADMRH